MSSFSRVFSAGPHLLRGELITVETDIGRGLHSFSIVGLPDKAVEEARDRVSAAIKNSGFGSPKSKNEKVVVSLSPADIKKEGSCFDLAIAIGYLLAADEIAFDPANKMFLGELSLNGELRPIRGALALSKTAKELGFTELYLPNENTEEAALVEAITVYGVGTLAELVDHLNTKPRPKLVRSAPEPVKLTPVAQTELMDHEQKFETDFADIRGQETTKRGLEIAAAGGHNIILSGPPGTGKTMLARAFVSILPPLSRDAMLEITSIHSIAGALGKQLVTHPPFRAPHHTASYVSIVGGGANPKPGEVTLAHRGVLFLDEFPEFERRVIESLRQPLEDNVTTVSRAKGTATFPSNFILVAAMNPCPCGNAGSKRKQCVCTDFDRARYARKLSGPIVDRIDLSLTVPEVDYETLSGQPSGETSAAIRERVIRARTRQEMRFKQNERTIKTNSDMHAREIVRYAPLTTELRALLSDSAERLNLSARAFHRTIKLARTIADLADRDEIVESDLLEALQYRPRVRNG